MVEATIRYHDEEQIKKDIPALEDFVGTVEMKLKTLSKLFSCPDDCVSLELDCTELNGLSCIIDGIVEEVEYIYTLVNCHFCELSDKEYKKKHSIQAA